MNADDAAPPPREVQKRYWEGIKAREAEEDQDTERQFLDKISIHREEIDRLQDQRDELLAQVRALEVKCESQKSAATALASDFVAERDAIARQRDARRRKMRAWFESKTTVTLSSEETATRIEAEILDTRKASAADRSSPLVSSHQSVPENGSAPAPVPAPATGRGVPENGSAPAPAPSDPSPDAPSTVEVFDGEGRFVGSVETLKNQNPAVLAILTLPVCRRVRTRPGRPFDQARFATMYDPQYTFSNNPEGKPSRWLAAMIQAKGSVRPTGLDCVNCAKGLGPFEGCIVQSNSLFKKCGNCEWSKQPCYMPTADEDNSTVDVQSARASRTSRSGRTRSSLAAAPEPEERDAEVTQSQETVLEKATQKRTKPVSRASSNGPAAPGRESSQDASASDDDDDDESTLTSGALITPDSLQLKHNGQVYTEPKCMRDVPVEKISPAHPYYLESWDKDILTSIRDRLEAFRQRTGEYRESGDKSKMFMNQRQVNRGERTIWFVEQSPIHPFQLVAKSYMQESIVSYDTLFRLAETYHELEGYHSNGSCLVTPGDWIRQRLHELITDFEQTNKTGKFSLIQAVKTLYGDQKLLRLRLMNGKKSVGRPIGASSKKRSSTKRKRSMGPALTVTQAETPDAGLPTPSGDDENAPPAKKRKGKKASRDADLRYKGFTDMDEASATPVYVIDWALSSVRCRKWASPSSLNQYWHFVQDDDEGCFFEHQGYMGIQESSGERTWAVYDPPVYFGFLPQDVEEVLWAPGTPKVIVRCKPESYTEEDGEPRGNLIAEFRRERTKRRFIVFCQKRDFQVTKTREIEIEHAWESMDPQIVHMVQETPSTESD